VWIKYYGSYLVYLYATWYMTRDSNGFPGALRTGVCYYITNNFFPYEMGSECFVVVHGDGNGIGVIEGDGVAGSGDAATPVAEDPSAGWGGCESDLLVAGIGILERAYSKDSLALLCDGKMPFTVNCGNEVGSDCFITSHGDSIGIG